MKKVNSCVTNESPSMRGTDDSLVVILFAIALGLAIGVCLLAFVLDSAK